jgi:hypothetical protein
VTQEERILRGRAAARLMGDELAAQALAAIAADATAAWRNSRPEDVVGREDAFRMLRAIDLLRDKLQAWVQDGQLEEHNAKTRDQARTNGETHA